MFTDLRYAARILSKNPGFSFVAILALALGIGPNTAIFSFVEGVLLRPLTYPEPDRLLQISANAPERGVEHDPISFTKFEAIRDQQQVFTEVAATTQETLSLTGKGEPEQINAQRVTVNFFKMLGLPPALGRSFLPEEDQPGGPKVVLLSHGFWQRRFGGDPAVIGETVQLDGIAQTIIGILPKTLAFPFNEAEVWRPRVFELSGISRERIQRGAGFLRVIGRLKPSVPPRQATEELEVISRRYAVAFPDRVDTAFGVTARPLQEDLVADVRPRFLLLLGAAVFVFLIACANVANLFLARVSGRRKEIAVRIALGASRKRIIEQFLTESLLLVSGGAMVALLFAQWALRVFVSIGGETIPRAAEISLDSSVLMFTIGISLVMACLLGLFPAIQASRCDVNEALQDASRGAVGGTKNKHFRNALILVEVALSFVLLIGAALLAISFRNVQHITPGFKPDHLFIAAIALPPAKYVTDHQQVQFFDQLISRLETSPGVTKCSAIRGLPFSQDIASTTYAVGGRPQLPLTDRQLAIYHSISDDYFATMQIPLVQGRYFNQHDNEQSPNVVVINETFARQLFPDQNALGQRIITGVQHDAVNEIVGVVRDTRVSALNEPSRAEMYLPMRQLGSPYMMIVVRTESDPSTFAGTARAAVRAVDGMQPIARTQTMTELMSGTLAGTRVTVMVFGAFSIIALGLTSSGIYSIISYSVSQRTDEIGIRMALGARSEDVLKLIIRQGMRPVAIGIVAGLAAALALTHVLASMLYGRTAYDPPLFVVITISLSLLALLACYLPARRAARVDPMSALRYQ